jgi:hypothetical protein
MKKFFTLSAILFFSLNSLFAVCPPGEVEVVITIIPDNYPAEITWDLKDINNTTIASGGSVGGTYCVSDTTCMTFTIHDSYGDGICCGYGNGSYTVTMDGVQVATGGNYTYNDITSFNCPPGVTCSSAITVTPGTYTASGSDTWYTFTPTAPGMYLITTCSTNTCDTKIWIYDQCANLVWNNTNQGTLYYDDDNGGCGIQAQISAALDPSETYIIRIGDDNGACGSSAIEWELQYTGPITGCMDPSACNYNPLATVSSGTCLYWPDVNCPDGPDLMVVQSAIENSLVRDQFPAQNCWVQEGCLRGYGDRTVIRFTTHIKNIGATDYYIGNPGTNPGQFTFGNCHGHPHYEGYAEYVLYKNTGQTIPIGFKNGFCVLDLECSGGGTAQYGCSNMGISTGCGDIYGAGLDCQWIDITDVDPGSYILAVKVNWDQSPDALGRVESDYVNNWAQVCITIFIDSNNEKDFFIDSSCPPYVDCAGTPYGNTVLDCNGVCGGTTYMGDLEADSDQDTTDAQMYVDKILDANIPLTSCNDLNNDNLITVWDAALMTHCYNDATPFNSACTFPYGAINTSQMVEMRIDSLNITDNYVDIEILNSNNKINAFEFVMSGLNILNVVPLYNTTSFPEDLQFRVGGNRVIGISYIDSAIAKNTVFSPFVRIYYSAITDTVVCISQIVHMVNPNFEATLTNIVDGCSPTTDVGIDKIDPDNYIIAYPNPSQGEIFLDIHSITSNGNVEILNAFGEVIYAGSTNGNERKKINLENVAAGIYFIRYVSGTNVITKKIIIE